MRSTRISHKFLLGVCAETGGIREKGGREATQKRAALVAQVRYKVNALRIQFNTLTQVGVASTKGKRERWRLVSAT